MNVLKAFPPAMACLVFAVSVACSDGDNAPATATSTPGALATLTATAEANAGSPTAIASATEAAHPPGSTDPLDLTASPSPPQGVALLVDVRVGANPELGGWDRIVFEFSDSLPNGTVSYVNSVFACGSGEPVVVRGSALLVVSFNPAAAHDDEGQLTIPGTRLDGPGFSILEARQSCDFEAEVAWVLGVTGRNNFTVVQLAEPPRVVIDIKQ